MIIKKKKKYTQLFKEKIRQRKGRKACHCGVVTLDELINFSPFSAWCCPVWKGNEFESQLQTKLKNHRHSLNLIFIIQEVGVITHISWIFSELKA